MLNFTQFNGYFGCTYCEHPGDSLPGKSKNNIRYGPSVYKNRTHEDTMAYAKEMLNSKKKSVYGVKVGWCT